MRGGREGGDEDLGLSLVFLCDEAGDAGVAVHAVRPVGWRGDGRVGWRGCGGRGWQVGCGGAGKEKGASAPKGAVVR
jgi:hypothetical protein